MALRRGTDLTMRSAVRKMSQINAINAQRSSQYSWNLRCRYTSRNMVEIIAMAWQNSSPTAKHRKLTRMFVGKTPLTRVRFHCDDRSEFIRQLLKYSHSRPARLREQTDGRRRGRDRKRMQQEWKGGWESHLYKFSNPALDIPERTRASRPLGAKLK